MSNKPTTTTATMLTDCVGGPLDGFYGPKQVKYQPGAFPRFGYRCGKKQYVYQAMGFFVDETKPLTFAFVQTLGLDESIFD